MVIAADLVIKPPPAIGAHLRCVSRQAPLIAPPAIPNTAGFAPDSVVTLSHFARVENRAGCYFF